MIKFPRITRENLLKSRGCSDTKMHERDSIRFLPLKDTLSDNYSYYHYFQNYTLFYIKQSHER